MSRAGSPPPFRIRTARVLRVLNSPGRMAVVDALLEAGPRSAAEVATAVECGVAAAHYHLNQLVQIGLVEEAGERETGARPERLFALTSPEIVVEPDKLTPAFRREMIRGARLFLRHAERDFADSIEADGAKHREGKRLRITRDIVRLSDDDLAILEAKLLDIDAFLRERDDRSKEHRVGLTMLLSPIARQGAKPPRSDKRGS